MPRLQRMGGLAHKQYFREFWALKEISLEVKKGETVGIIGRNVSGKSTLLQIICGALSPTSGSIQPRLQPFRCGEIGQQSFVVECADLPVQCAGAPILAC